MNPSTASITASIMASVAHRDSRTSQSECPTSTTMLSGCAPLAPFRPNGARPAASSRFGLRVEVSGG